MDFAEIAAPAVSVASGGGAMALFNYLLDRRKLKNQERSEGITDREGIIKELNELLGIKERDCDEKIEKMRQDFAAQQARIAEMEQDVASLKKHELPICSWQKNMRGEYIIVNDMAVRTIFAPLGKTRRDIIGKADADIWPDPAIAQAARDIDRTAMQSRDKRACRLNVQLDPSLPSFAIFNVIVSTDNPSDPINYVAYLHEHELVTGALNALTASRP